MSKDFVQGAVVIELKTSDLDDLLEDTLTDASMAGSLTNREREILSLIISGKINKEIARKICRTERTVEYHRNHLMRKLDAHNAVDLVKRAIAMGIK